MKTKALISCMVNELLIYAFVFAYAKSRFSHDEAQIVPRHEKTNVLVFDQVPHKPGCTATEDGQKLEILDLESRGIVLSV